MVGFRLDAGSQGRGPDARRSIVCSLCGPLRDPRPTRNGKPAEICLSLRASAIGDGASNELQFPAGRQGPTGTAHVARSLRDREWAWNNAVHRPFPHISNRHRDLSKAAQSGGMGRSECESRRDSPTCRSRPPAGTRTAVDSRFQPVFRARAARNGKPNELQVPAGRQDLQGLERFSGVFHFSVFIPQFFLKRRLTCPHHRLLTSAAWPRYGTPPVAWRLPLFLLVVLTLAAGAPFAAAEMVYYTEDFCNDGEPGFDPMFNHELDWPDEFDEENCWHVLVIRRRLLVEACLWYIGYDHVQSGGRHASRLCVSRSARRLVPPPGRLHQIRR